MRRRTILDSIGWNEYLRPFLYKELPPGTGWMPTLGSVCVMLFGVMVISGVALAMYYNPSPDKAYQSIDYIMREVHLGSVLRGIHHWSAGAMVLTVFVHLLANFFSGTFRPPRHVTWMVGVLLFLVTLALGFTGYLLPWDLKAYWATVVATNIPRDVPLIGDFATRLARGGQSISGLTLTRFYAMHVALLPALLALGTLAHIFLVRLHGITPPAKVPEPRSVTSTNGEAPYRFYPEHMLRSLLVFGAVFAVILGLAVFGRVPTEPVAGTRIDSYLPRPEWYYMWLFQLLTYFPGAWESVGSLLIPLLAVGLLFVVPFLGNNMSARLSRRPLAMAVGVTSILGMVHLSLMGFGGARPYGNVVAVPNRQLTPTEARGLRLFVDNQCAYCHQIHGVGGRRVGPDLANTVARRRSADYLTKYIKAPQTMSPASIMPKYDLPEGDLQALSAFLLALDFSQHAVRIVKREEIVDLRAALSPH